jgi:hypothetical protein
MNISMKIFKGRQSSCPLGVSIKGIVLAFNSLKCLCGFFTSIPQQGDKYQL